MAIQQLLREWPPGFGGVERVAHELGNVWGGVVYSLDVQRQGCLLQDALPVTYPRRRLRSFRVLGRLRLPLPTRSLILLLASSQPLHGHLPSPGVLLLLVLARLIRPRRVVTAHWHCFLETTPDLNGRLFGFYQWIALRIIPYMSAVVTTSPVMSDELHRCGSSSVPLVVLPCCLSASQEDAAMAVPLTFADQGELMRVLFAGRLDSYKRLDWLLQSCPCSGRPGSCRLWGMDLIAVVLSIWRSNCFQLSFEIALIWCSFMVACLRAKNRSRLQIQMCWFCPRIAVMRLLA